MALDPRKRQRKVERRKAKEKKRELAERASHDLSLRLERATSAPILHCCVNRTIWRRGMGNVLVSRELPKGGVAFVTFLVDTYCLGLKDVILGIVSRPEYDWKIHGKLCELHDFEDLAPEKARKLVEQAIIYAQSLGFAPPADYQRARLIFGDIDAAACTEEFEFGHNGQPLFIAGPTDSAARCARILENLRGRLGGADAQSILHLSSVGGPAGFAGISVIPDDELEGDEFED